MTGCIALRKDVYYVRLTYYDSRQKRKEKWVSTGLSGRGAKQKATANFFFSGLLLTFLLSVFKFFNSSPNIVIFSHNNTTTQILRFHYLYV